MATLFVVLCIGEKCLAQPMQKYWKLADCAKFQIKVTELPKVPANGKVRFICTLEGRDA